MKSSKKYILPFIFAFFSILSGILLFKFVEFTPQVDKNFFFASDDPQLEQGKLIDEMFRGHELLIITAAGDIRSPEYLRDISYLTRELSGMDATVTVFSLASGPFSVEDAVKSPLWSRILISEQEAGSNVLAFMHQQDTYESSMKRLELLRNELHRPSFHMAITGVPWVSYQIQKSLIEELKTFTFAALAVIVIWVLIIYRSLTVLLGSVVSCASACFLTFLCLDLFNIEAGVLSANLWSIVFVLTLSHIVFITGNWQVIKNGPRQLNEEGDAISLALRATGPGSLLAMLTTLLGFLALLLTVARPIQQFGLAGAIGALIAIFAAYIIYPSYLRLLKNQTSGISKTDTNIGRVFQRNQKWGLILVPLMVVGSALGVPSISTDRALFDYFQKGSELREALVQLDEAGGTNPLDIVIKDPSETPYASDEGYIKLWNLQNALETNPAVGKIISLPVLMSEIVVSPIAPLVTWEMIMQALEGPLLGHVAHAFVTDDRKHTRFLVRMRETEVAQRDRMQVITQLDEIVNEQGFKVEIWGGLYMLQAQLSALVQDSLIQGLLWLMALFFLISLVASLSFKVALVMLLCLVTIPFFVLGIIGHLSIPLDIISAPGINIGLAIGVDGMIHMVIKAKKLGGRERYDWRQARLQLWKPILASTVVVASGFGTFTLSHFPPSRQLGGIVALGAIVALFIILFFFIQLVPKNVFSPKRKN